jgi:hypothetical protein
MKVKPTNESIAASLQGIDFAAIECQDDLKIWADRLNTGSDDGFVVLAPIDYYDRGVLQLTGVLSSFCIYTSDSDSAKKGKWDNKVYVNRSGLCEIDSTHGVLTRTPETIAEVLQMAAEYKASVPLRVIPLSCPEGEYLGFTYEFSIPHALFKIFEYENPIGYGLVFNINDLPEYKEGDI